MDIHVLEKIARRIVGRSVSVTLGNEAATDGASIMVLDVDALFPGLPLSAREEIAKFLAGHEAGHIKEFDRIAKKMRKPSLSSEEFYQIFADPSSPGLDSQDYVRFMLNVVEDELVDLTSAQAVGPKAHENTNRFFIWNRQGGKRPSMAELEGQGSMGKCAAWIEALFQLSVYGELIESFYSPQLEYCAAEAVKARSTFGQGGISRSEALKRVLDALRKYCPPPWKTPPEYKPPKGEGGGSGSGSGDPAQGSQSGQGEGAGDGYGNPSDHDADGKKGEGGKNSPDGEPSDSDEEGKPKKGDPSPGDSTGEEGEEREPESLEETEESEGSDQGTPQESNQRGTESGEEAGDPVSVEPAAEPRFEDNNLEALLNMLERVLTERSKQAGRGMPRYRTWSPGDVIQSPEEIARYQEDEVFGIDPLERRCVRQRDREEHLLAVFLDSSGSVGGNLFSQLYRVIGELAEKVSQTPGIMLGVGQFSGGACWVLEPTQSVQEIQDFAEQEPKRLYSGGTTVGEIYGLLPDSFAGYKTADLIVLTDGYVEQGEQLVQSLEAAHVETGCEIKLHGVVFKDEGTLKQFKDAKNELPAFVRTWHLGGE